MIDIGFGDAVEPAIYEVELPVLLDSPPPRLRAYPRETVIAEKFQAIVMIGRANSRMKNLYDIWVLSQAYEFEATASPRNCRDICPPQNANPERATRCLDARLCRRPGKQQQWTSFAEGIEEDLPRSSPWSTTSPHSSCLTRPLRESSGLPGRGETKTTSKPERRFTSPSAAC